jgi:hypothetical protein
MMSGAVANTTALAIVGCGALMLLVASKRSNHLKLGEKKMQSRSLISMNRAILNLSRAFVLIGLPALLYGCATDKPITPFSTHKTISINVYTGAASTPSGWTCTGQGRYTICVDEDPIDLSQDTRPITIPWSLITQGWTFTHNRGIQIRGGGWAEHEQSPTQYTAVSHAKDGKLYKYTISVTNGTDTVIWDPFIWNN